MITDADGVKVPDPDYLPLPDFSALSENSVFNVNWDTKEGQYMSGTAFMLSCDLAEKPFLVTAIHYFGKEVSVSGKDLPEYVLGGELYDILGDYDQPSGVLAGALPIVDAVGVGDAQSVDRDLAAFWVEDTSQMNSLALAEGKCKPGDMIYLAAYLDNDVSNTYDDSLYPCVVISDDGKELTYMLSDDFVTQGASGAPLLNTAGEVVGIHIGSNGSERYGHSIQSIYGQLETALSNS